MELDPSVAGVLEQSGYRVGRRLPDGELAHRFAVEHAELSEGGVLETVALTAGRSALDSACRNMAALARQPFGPRVASAVTASLDPERAYQHVLRLPSDATSISSGQRMSNDTLVAAASQMCEAIGDLHRRGFVHGSLSPSVFFATASGVVLGDLWGLRTSLGEPLDPGATVLAPRKSAQPFTAFEVLSGQPPSRASDIFSIGAVLWSLVTGRVPGPSDLSPKQLASLEVSLRPDAWGMIGEMLAVSPQERRSATILYPYFENLRSARP